MGDPLVDDSWQFGKGQTITILQDPLRTRFHITGEVPWSIPPHWHTMHDEHHTVLKGTLIVMQDGVRRVVRPETGPLLTRIGVVHSLETLLGEETIIEETTLQAADVATQKIYFFRNLFYPGILQSFFGAMQVFYHGDTYVELPIRTRWLEWLMVVVIGGWVAPLLGYKIPDRRLRMDPKRFPPKKTI
ncbi:hypothetical protein K438DRAFT_1987762 [Mycena galopus ATCC 62051]|nr:hypothetical protein K438DRAFT_1987762 [Mycena galopus ATCC 62051]